MEVRDLLGQDSRGALTGWVAGGPELQGEAIADWFVVEFPPPPTAAREEVPWSASGAPPAQAWTWRGNDQSWMIGFPLGAHEGAPAWRFEDLPQAAPLPVDTLWLQSMALGRHPQSQEGEDQLWIRTSVGTLDRQRGYLLEWGEAGLHFETVAGERWVDWDRVQGLGLLPEQVPVQEGAVWLQLQQGSVFSARIEALEQGKLTLELPWKARWVLPLEAVRRIRRRADLEEWGGAQGWEVVAQPASKVLDWGPRFGRSVEGRTLRLAGLRFAQGIGMKAPTTLRRELTQAGTLLLCVGIDDEVASFKNPQPMRLEVRLDGERLWRSPSLRVGQTFHRAEVRIPSAGQLELHLEADGPLDFGGHVDVVDVVFRPSADHQS